MLYNVVIDRKTHNYDWTLGEENYLSSENMHQRLRIDNSILDGFTVEKKDEDTVADAHVTTYDIPTCRYICNNKTLNPVLMGTNRPADESDNVIIFLVVNTGFRIADYTLHNENRKNLKVLRTFKISHEKRVTHVGCTIVGSKKDLMEKGNSIITLNLVKLRNAKEQDSVVRYDLSLEGNSVNVVCENLDNHPDAEKYREIVASKKRFNGFNFHVLPNQMLTCTLLCPESRVEEAEEVSKHLKKRFIVPIKDDSIADPEAIKKALTEIDVANNHIRAITVLGMSVPKEVTSEFRILYVFNYNEDTKTLDLVR